MKFYKITLYQGKTFKSDRGWLWIKYYYWWMLLKAGRISRLALRNLMQRNADAHEGFTCVWWRESKAEAEELIEQMRKLWGGKWWEQHVGPQNPQGVVTETMNGYPEITEVDVPTDKKGLFEFIENNAYCEYDRAEALMHFKLGYRSVNG